MFLGDSRWSSHIANQTVIPATWPARTVRATPKRATVDKKLGPRSLGLPLTAMYFLLNHGLAHLQRTSLPLVSSCWLGSSCPANPPGIYSQHSNLTSFPLISCANLLGAGLLSESQNLHPQTTLGWSWDVTVGCARVPNFSLLSAPAASLSSGLFCRSLPTSPRQPSLLLVLGNPRPGRALFYFYFSLFRSV